MFLWTFHVPYAAPCQHCSGLWQCDSCGGPSAKGGGRGAELQMEREGSEKPNFILPLPLLCSLGCRLPEAQGAKWKLFIFPPLITESLRLEKTSKIIESNQGHVPGRTDRSAAVQSAAGV